MHFLLKCKTLSNVRTPFITKLTTSYPNILKLPDDKKFVWIMSSEDHKVITILSKLLSSLFEKRKEILTNKELNK